MVLNKSEGLYVIVEDQSFMHVSFGGIIALFLIFLAVEVAFYVLRSIGLYVLAKKNGINNAFIAWIPFAWIYTACKLIGETKIFGWSFDKIALIAMIIFSVNGVANLLYNFFNYFPCVGYVLQGGTLTMEENIIYYGTDFVNPYGSAAKAIDVACTVIYYVNYILSLVVMVIEIFMYISLFRKFWSQHYILASVLSAITGLFPIFVFAVRNKPATNYADYVRSRYYYYNEPYGQNPPPDATKSPEHPFEEFADRGEKDPGDPFSEFSDKDDK